MPDYDVIIIGGRCAGSPLAIRLAQQKLKVLVIDRANFPSLPAIASSPTIHNGTMRILDELGLNEDDYTLPGSKVENYVIDFVDHFSAIMPYSITDLERGYARGVDRAHFDYALWKHMESLQPYVTACQNFAFVDVLKDESGKVTGITCKNPNGEAMRVTADLVVGADGRFSIAASKFGAKVVEERNEFANGGYEAQWEGVAPYADGVANEFSAYIKTSGYATVFIPIASGRYYVSAYMRSQFVQRGNLSTQEFYIESLKRMPKAWERLANAKQITSLKGMRPVKNGYREAYGSGWALLGDAFHYKDPIDGQGIYDALIEGKYLADAIADWKSGKLTWEQAGEQYKENAYAATYPMFDSTTKRIKREIHTTPPKLIVNTILRWMLTDPDYQRTFLRGLSREIPPSEVPSMPNLGMITRGIWRSFQKNTKK